MKPEKHFYILIYILFTISCARQTTPTGGPKDTIPPTLVSSNPSKNQTFYKGKTVQLVFSEMIALANPKEQIIIAPSVEKAYEITTRNRTATITFEKDLKDSTTYTINFRDAVQDITEKNPVANLQLAFSTGSYVDSLSISGNTYDLQKGNEYKDVTLAIYDSDTFNIFKHKPTYLTKSDAKGKFKFTNLKQGHYFLYAVDDRNRNIIVDSKNESYGFTKQKINLTKDTANISIPLTKLDARPLKLSNARPYSNYFNIKTSKNISSYQITSSHPGDTITSGYGQDRANIQVYNTLNIADSLQINLTAFDSIGNRLDTTLQMKFSKRETTPDKYSYGINEVEVLKDRGSIIASITFNKPTRISTLDSIFYQIDSAKIVTFSLTDFTWNRSTNTVYLRKNFDKSLLLDPPKNDEIPRTKTTPQRQGGKSSPAKKINNQFVIGKGAFQSVDNDTTKNLTKDARPIKTEELGVIKVHVKSSIPTHITELITKDGRIVKSSYNKTNFDFNDVTPGEYIIRTIIDLNANGKWDPGNYFQKLEPEPIVFYRNEKLLQGITLKANWELGPLLITY